ncbi:MAG: hypothetical protein Q9227_004000 [Pyrenula ochraceoflavens]
MATLTPVRQPFGVVDGSRLRTLASKKNTQAAIISANPSSKRRHTSPDNSDSENVDPDLFKFLGKRKRTDNDWTDSEKPSKYHSSFSLTVQPQSTPSFTPRTDTPRLTVSSTKPSPIVTPASAPAAAGRSPTKARKAGILGNRRVSSNGSIKYKGLGPPSYGLSKSRAPPLSLAAALNGTFARSKRRNVATLEESVPKAWDFKIYEDTEEEHAFNLLGHSVTNTDIDENKRRSPPPEPDDDKENVPPGFMSVPPNTRSRTAAAAAAKKDMMVSSDRAPLGDLQPSDFYGPGCDATSFVLVAGDDGAAAEPATSSSIAAALEAKPEAPLLDKEGLDRLIRETVPLEAQLQQQDTKTEEGLAGEGKAEGEEGGDIEIWESGSAKDEAMEDGERVVESIFAP